MIGYLCGKVIDRGESWVIIDAGGVGYKVYVPADTLLSAKPNETIPLFCHHHFTQEGQSLYGFARRKDLDLFEMLIDIPGVGPKAALSILSHSRAEEIENAILRGDAALFTAVSGVGQKKADHIILELKPKLAGRDDLKKQHVGADSKTIVTALERLGYKRTEIMETIKNMPSDLTSDSERVKWALRHLYR